MNILFRIPEILPTQRPDVSVLFGLLLPRQDIHCYLVALTEGVAPCQEGCKIAFSLARGRGRLGNLFRSFVLDISLIFLARHERYDAIQVRDCIWGGLAALIAGRLFNKPVYYWASYLGWESARARSREGGIRQGLTRWLYSQTRDFVNGIIFKNLLLPRFDHVFVQSDAMRSLFARFGCRPDKMTVVPMGVDFEAIERARTAAATTSASGPGPVLAYLGLLARERRITFLVDVLNKVREPYPTAKLLLVGDAIEAVDRQEIERYAAALGLSDAVQITGWKQPAEAWAIVQQASVALSALPRSIIFDVSFPTKTVEYLALGLAVVVNDIPAQADIIEKSAAGRCVPMDVIPFSEAVVELLQNPALRRQMGESGRAYVRQNLAYGQLAASLEICYRKLLNSDGVFA